MTYRALMIVFLGCVASATNASDVSSRHSRDLETAIKVIAASLSQANSGSDDFRGPAAEMSLALLASHNDLASVRAFASLLAYRLDGGLSEDFHCYALANRAALGPVLHHLDADQIVKQCKIHMGPVSSTDAGANASNMCLTPDQVVAAVKSLRSDLAARKSCDPEDF
jgi:hypothetical protein